MRIITHIVGNRPQFVKLALLYNELAKQKNVSQEIIHTGQHYTKEMSGIFFSDLSIPPPTITLEITDTSNPDVFIGNTSSSLQKIFNNNNKRFVIVYGDTNTTLAAALSASRAGIPFAHIEAGVRTGDNTMPEEINRILTDRLANINFCCTQHNYNTLLNEGYSDAIFSTVFFSGDLMYDAFLKHSSTDETHPLLSKNFVLCTIHRAQNILSENVLSQIVNALNTLHQSMEIVVPLHPHTKKRIEEYRLETTFTILPPLNYTAMKSLMMRAEYIITDSGGVAREAFFCQKKSITVMPQPFWPEIITAGCSIKTAPYSEEIIQAFHHLTLLNPDFSKPIFGNGNAAELIVQKIVESDVYHS